MRKTALIVYCTMIIVSTITTIILMVYCDCKDNLL
jgi:hypothetical protein